jgi:hypothetical protein
MMFIALVKVVLSCLVCSCHEVFDITKCRWIRLLLCAQILNLWMDVFVSDFM